jgi:hypothetical protein
MIKLTDNNVKYCDVCSFYHSFPNLNNEGECNYCKKGEQK